MTKHTPGPWTTVERRSFGQGNKRIQYWYDGGATDVAQALKPATMTIATYESNARLIAAAPEMLAELRGLVQWIEDNAPVQGDPRSEWCDNLESARALLARIEGKES